MKNSFFVVSNTKNSFADISTTKAVDGKYLCNTHWEKTPNENIISSKFVTKFAGDSQPSVINTLD